MALSTAERKRLETAEDVIQRLAKLIEGGGSTNQLNRLLVLANNEISKLTIRVAALETEITTLLTLVRKLQ